MKMTTTIRMSTIMDDGVDGFNCEWKEVSKPHIGKEKCDFHPSSKYNCHKNTNAKDCELMESHTLKLKNELASEADESASLRHKMRLFYAQV